MKAVLSFLIFLIFIIFSFSFSTAGKTQGIDVKKSISIKSNKSKKISSYVDVDLAGLILAIITTRLENTQPPYDFCKLIQKPPLPADFGITAENQNGWIDKNKAEYLAKASKFNMSVKDFVDLDFLKEYVICIVTYAELVSRTLQTIGNKTYLIYNRKF
jgi:hypothetical protein